MNKIEIDDLIQHKIPDGCEEIGVLLGKTSSDVGKLHLVLGEKPLCNKVKINFYVIMDNPDSLNLGKKCLVRRNLQKINLCKECHDKMRENNNCAMIESEKKNRKKKEMDEINYFNERLKGLTQKK